MTSPEKTTSPEKMTGAVADSMAERTGRSVAEWADLAETMRLRA